MDFTPRFEGRCPDFVGFDLNANLYVYEKNLEWMVGELNLAGEPDWEQAQRTRDNLPLFEFAWGLSPTGPVESEYTYQWEHPSC